MKKAAVIFNGIQFHYYLIDHAIDWAVRNNAQLLGLFVHSTKEPPEGYIFPSDIDPAENLYGKGEAEQGNELVIKSQQKLFVDLAKSKHVQAATEEASDPTLDDMAALVTDMDRIFVDEAFDEAALLPCLHFNLHKLIHHLDGPVEVVKEEKD